MRALRATALLLWLAACALPFGAALGAQAGTVKSITISDRETLVASGVATTRTQQVAITRSASGYARTSGSATALPVAVPAAGVAAFADALARWRYPKPVPAALGWTDAQVSSLQDELAACRFYRGTQAALDAYFAAALVPAAYAPDVRVAVVYSDGRTLDMRSQNVGLFGLPWRASLVHAGIPSYDAELSRTLAHLLDADDPLGARLSATLERDPVVSVLQVACNVGRHPGGA